MDKMRITLLKIKSESKKKKSVLPDQERYRTTANNYARIIIKDGPDIRSCCA